MVLLAPFRTKLSAVSSTFWADVSRAARAAAERTFVQHLIASFGQHARVLYEFFSMSDPVIGAVIVRHIDELEAALRYAHSTMQSMLVKAVAAVLEDKRLELNWAGEVEADFDQTLWRAPDPKRAWAQLVIANRARAALSVFSIRQAIVMGPTPPGTGVIAPATWMASSRATSPTTW